MDMEVSAFFDFVLFTVGSFELTVKKIFLFTLVFFFTKLLVWVVNGYFLKSYFTKKQLNDGRQYAIQQITKYFLYILGILLAFQSIGIHPTALLASGAALMVGIGLGLQQTFNDVISGVILLFESSVEVNDIVVINGVTGKVRKIGLRTSLIETRDEIVQIVPNSKIVGDGFINWSHNEKPSRFQVKVGVAYSSDFEDIEAILLEIARTQKGVLTSPAPSVQFLDFGESSLDFNLNFYSLEYWDLEKIRSELRYKIARAFKANNIEIPFPQRDVWFRNLDSTTIVKQNHNGASVPGV